MGARPKKLKNGIFLVQFSDSDGQTPEYELLGITQNVLLKNLKLPFSSRNFWMNGLALRILRKNYLSSKKIFFDPKKILVGHFENYYGHFIEKAFRVDRAVFRKDSESLNVSGLRQILNAR